MSYTYPQSVSYTMNLVSSGVSNKYTELRHVGQVITHMKVPSVALYGRSFRSSVRPFPRTLELS